MKGILLFLIMMTFPLSAQSIFIQKGTTRQIAQPLGNGMYATQLDGQAYLLMPKATVDSLLKQVEILNTQNERYTRVLAAKDSLLRAYKNFERHAQQYIAVQKQLLFVADSLYNGYKNLYRDARALIGYGKYALWGQVTLARMGTPAVWQALGSVGIGYQNWMVGYQFGNQFQGVSVGIRWPVGW